MTDRLSPVQRHHCMSRIRSRNTKPELKVRQWLWQHGYRYRLNVKGVPGKPDIVMRKYHTAIFVNGCFWHGHEIEWRTENGEWRVENSICCKLPQSNREFWVNKIRRNQERDQQNYKVLQDNGWQVLVIWECQLKPKLLEKTMRWVEVCLQDYYISTFSPKAAHYIFIEETDLPLAAEDDADYSVE